MFISLKTVLDLYHVKGFYIVSPVHCTQFNCKAICISQGVFNFVFIVFVTKSHLLKKTYSKQVITHWMFFILPLSVYKPGEVGTEYNKIKDGLKHKVW